MSTVNNKMIWRRSSYSGVNGNCVEVADILPDFRKSSYSGQGQNCVEVNDIPPNFQKSSYSAHGQNCVEVADLPCGAAVRDSKNPGAGHLPFPSSEWTAFLTSAGIGHRRP